MKTLMSFVVATLLLFACETAEAQLPVLDWDGWDNTTTTGSAVIQVEAYDTLDTLQEMASDITAPHKVDVGDIGDPYYVYADATLTKLAYHVADRYNIFRLIAKSEQSFWFDCDLGYYGYAFSTASAYAKSELTATKSGIVSGSITLESDIYSPNIESGYTLEGKVTTNYGTKWAKAVWAANKWTVTSNFAATTSYPAGTKSFSKQLNFLILIDSDKTLTAEARSNVNFDYIEMQDSNDTSVDRGTKVSINIDDVIQ